VNPVPNLVVLIGSLRKDPLNRKLANAMIELNAAPLKFEITEIGNLPLYNQNLEGENAPAAWGSFRQKITRSDAVLFVTPEYNRSVPGALKNALDVASRPFGSQVVRCRGHVAEVDVRVVLRQLATYLPRLLEVLPGAATQQGNRRSSCSGEG
jgi:NAD(P)H-dependent FMN reductase